ncbi:MAG: NgoBV family restriction endonuclease [Microcystaceae cyanobacterium]
MLTPQEIYNRLIQDKITESQGEIVFDFLNISVKINEKSAIGDLFQEWLAAWMSSKNIYFRTKPNSQEFPDFLLNPNSDTTDLLEIKTFDSGAVANFDVANFEAYCRSLKTQAYRLDSNYLIFSYNLINYQFTIKQIWLKKVWEITGRSKDYPIKSQVKQKAIINIRPISWYSKRAKFSPFTSRREFVLALHKTLLQYSKTKDFSADWLQIVEDNYSEYTGKKL